MNVSDYLSQLQTLTKQNLEILQAINDSFLTKKEHLTASIGDSTYIIPSFISLENKINSLEANFENLVNAPLTGEAYFNFDGNSQAIEMRGFNCSPDKLSLPIPNKFEVESNDIFKDFLTPNPYVNFDITSISDDINSVVIRKVIPRTDELTSIFKGLLNEESSKSVNWSDLNAILLNYIENQDYVMYDTEKSLPIRKSIGEAKYVVSEIVSDTIDDNLDEYITLKIRSDFSDVDDSDLYTSDLTYKLFDELTSKNLKVGDYLVTYNNGTKFQISEVKPAINTMTVKVINGEYINLVGSPSGAIQDLSILKLFSLADSSDSKYIHVSLEEDQYVFVAIAPLNNRLRVRAQWGGGVLLDTYSLVDSNGTYFKTYYDENVRNIGDTLYSITSMMDNFINKYTKEQFELFSNAKPIVNESGSDIEVYQINSHLNDSTTIKNIRNLYSQKKQYETELSAIQTEIDTINKNLSTISFDDTSGQRSALTANLDSNSAKKNELITSINKIIDEISQNANNSDVPIENAKYRIRGFYDYKTLYEDDTTLQSLIENHIVGIEVWYRYKNSNKEQGTAKSINDNFIFSDWNKMDSFEISKVPYINSNQAYKFKNESYNDNVNEPSFNQIDIPISSGESVDIKLRVIYDFGRPFIKSTSAWSDIYNIEFPTEFTKDVQILDIISENNNDIETNRFSNILSDNGITDHVNDKIQDQDITYYHKPENISSGFYTTERRIIPLKDKLVEMNNSIQEITDELYNSSTNNIKVTATIGSSSVNIDENIINNVPVASYSSVTDNSSYITDGAYTRTSDGIVSVLMNINLINNSSHTVKLYPIFPGTRNTTINKYTYNEKWKQYASTVSGVECGVWSLTKKDTSSAASLQVCNQFIYFRINDIWTSEEYYKTGSTYDTNDRLSMSQNYYQLPKNTLGAAAYPVKQNEYSLCLNSEDKRGYMTLNEGEIVSIPICFEYYLSSDLESISKIMSFDLRTSLFEDPINYTFRIVAKLQATPQDKLLDTNNSTLYVKYNDTTKA